MVEYNKLIEQHPMKVTHGTDSDRMQVDAAKPLSFRI